VPIKTVEVRVTARIRSMELGGGLPGPIGVSITGGTVNGSGHLILTLSNGGTIDAGYVIGPPGPISSLTETGNGIIIDNTNPSDPVLSLDATLEAIANFATGANKVMVWSGTDTLTSFDVDTDVTLAANSDTRFATQKAVKAYADALIAANDAMVFKGVIDASANPNYPAADRGHTWRISVAGKIGGASGVNVEVGDLIICLTDGSAAGTQAAVGANWTISQTNLDGAVIGPAVSTDASIAGFNGTTGKLIKVLTSTEIRAAAVLATTDSPQFAGLNIGHATDTTITRASAGVLAVEGVQIINASGSQVIADKDLVDSSTAIVDGTDGTKKGRFNVDLVPTATERTLTWPNRSGVIATDITEVSDISPTLDLRFTQEDGALFDDYLSRPSIGGYRMNAKGVMVPTVADEPLIDFGSDGKPRGVGFFGAYTNLILRSEEFDNASWAKTNVTVSANAIASPDGNTTSDSLTRASNAPTYIQQSLALSIGNTITFSLFAKAKSAGNRIGLRLQGTYPDRVDAIFDLSTGLIVGSAAATFTGLSTAIDNVGGGWYRLSLTATITGTALTTVLFGPCDSSQSIGGWEAASAILSDCYTWGAQLTATAFPVPYVPTTSAAVARSADSMVITGSDFTEFFNPTEGTFYIESNGIPKSSHMLHVTRGLNSYGPRIQHIVNINSIPSLAVYDDTNTLVGYVEGASSVTGGKISFSYKQNDFKLNSNGQTTVLDTSGNLPSGLTSLEIGRSPNLDVSANGRISRLTYWPRAMSATELQRMTA
jgi:hypothetical protein